MRVVTSIRANWSRIAWLVTLLVIGVSLGANGILYLRLRAAPTQPEGPKPLPIG